MDTLAGIGFSPSEYVDITTVIDTKRRMLRCHQSQLQAVSDLASQDIEQVMEIQARFRGLAAGSAYAKGFTRTRGLAAWTHWPCPAQFRRDGHGRLTCCSWAWPHARPTQPTKFVR